MHLVVQRPTETDSHASGYTYNRAAHIVSHSLFNVVSVVVRGLVLSLGKVLDCFHTLNVGAR